ncbi:hypothetical protein U14_03413 [Candidatus Moduliflexus flocculans]|uniref:Effector-associated domain-containing protein n=1 Tax=Candidatus Moduliflexus flocculans TaxID=1499966 RepID=A0A081BP46_9BACT|nr:hypothetical protein U14_03413 [Candidatus Moduliflexus flocculans]
MRRDFSGMAGAHAGINRHLRDCGRHTAEDRASPPSAMRSANGSNKKSVRYQKQYEAVSQQKMNELNAMNQVALQNQLDDLERKMQEIEQQLAVL